ncbi:hypothetical protein [Glaciecola sp. 33A]|uniref:hypothetical protein n=1 Tax=Glaciecola sp. 33A TaxID=2057807 RepID=UPI0012FF5566|nr:hypothetical protein [Glaciecola sp. 33A]
MSKEDLLFAAQESNDWKLNRGQIFFDKRIQLSATTAFNQCTFKGTNPALLSLHCLDYLTIRRLPIRVLHLELENALCHSLRN